MTARSEVPFIPDRLRTVLDLSLPIVGGMASQNVLNLVDIAMVGTLGPVALAAVGLGSFANFMAMALVMGLSSGVQAMAARRKGEGRESEMAVALNGGLLLAIMIGLPILILLLWQAPVLFALLIDDPAVIAEGVPLFRGPPLRCLRHRRELRVPRLLERHQPVADLPARGSDHAHLQRADQLCADFRSVRLARDGHRRGRHRHHDRALYRQRLLHLDRVSPRPAQRLPARPSRHRHHGDDGAPRGAGRVADVPVRDRHHGAVLDHRPGRHHRGSRPPT